MAGFAPLRFFFFFFRVCCCAFSPLVVLTKRGPLSRSWKHLSNADSSSSFSPSFCLLPVRFLFPTGWPLVRAVWRMPLSHRALPPLCSQGTQGLLLLFEEAGRKSLEPHSKEKKSLSLWGGGVAPGHKGALWFFFFFLFSHEKMGWKSWADVSVAGGLGGSRTCRWL